MKRFALSIFLAISLLTLGAHADNSAVISIDYNAEFSERIYIDVDTSKLPTLPEATYLTLVCAVAETSGQLTIDNITRDFVLRGLPERVELSDGRVGYIGGLSGELDDGESIVISLHALPSESKYFIVVTTGTLTVNSDGETQDTLKTYAFGEYFDEIGELVERYMADKNPATDTDEIEKVEVVGGDTGKVGIVDIGSGDIDLSDIGFVDIASLNVNGVFRLIPAICFGVR